jgi:hypothetical protein
VKTLRNKKLQVEPQEGNKLVEVFQLEGYVISLEENEKEFQLVVHNATVLEDKRKKIMDVLLKRYNGKEGFHKKFGKKKCPIIWLVNLGAIFETMNRRMRQ